MEGDLKATAEDFLRSYTSKMKVAGVGKRAPKAKKALRKRPSRRMEGRNFSAEVLIWFPTKRPSLDVIKSLHPGILKVWLPRQNTARFCYLEFASEQEALKARQQIHKTRYEGSKGRLLQAMMRRRSTSGGDTSDAGGDHSDGRKSPVVSISKILKKKQESKTSEESTPLGQSPARKRRRQQKSGVLSVESTPFGQSEPGSLVRIRREPRTPPAELEVPVKQHCSSSSWEITAADLKTSAKKRKHEQDSPAERPNKTLLRKMVIPGKLGRFKKRLTTTSTPKSEPGSILRIKPKKKLGRVKHPRISL